MSVLAAYSYWLVQISWVPVLVAECSQWVARTGSASAPSGTSLSNELTFRETRDVPAFVDGRSVPVAYRTKTVLVQASGSAFDQTLQNRCLRVATR